eukprot:m.310480 g.310480  ORF g.310480 m.310480 type:complete len:674 (+) comp16477_c1_seq1:208-2229(+)
MSYSLSCGLLLLLFAQCTVAKFNILMFVIDDLGFADVGYHGNKYGSEVLTPTIDELSANGIRLESYYVNFLCSPTRTSLMSGRYAYTIGMNAEVITNGKDSCMPSSVSTIADRLKEGGWATSAYGKWDMGMTTWGCTPTCRGFDHFYGFYNAFNDYFTHLVGGFQDFRNDTYPAQIATGRYMTELLTEDAIRWVQYVNRTTPEKSIFSYLAHESNHGPMEVPLYYVTGHCADNIPSNHPARRIICGMMRAVDSSLTNLTLAYKDLGIWEDTIIIMSTDNGGQTKDGGNNFPLRGNKATSYEGGVRGVGWIGGGYSFVQRGVTYNSMVHVSDWYPTIVHGIAGLPINGSADGHPPLDGLDVWHSIITGTPSPRNETLLQLDAKNGNLIAAIRVGDWKLIKGTPANGGGTCYIRLPDSDNNTIPYPITPATSPPWCIDGWVPPPENGSNPENPPDTNCSSFPCKYTNNKYTQGGVWLFNILYDPTEHTDLSENPQYADALKMLTDRLQYYIDKNITQQPPVSDPASSPNNFGGIWTPWQGDPDPNACSPFVPPPPNPAPPSPPPGSCGIGNMGTPSFSKTNVTVQGWCSGEGFTGPARHAMLQVDGKTVASGIANVKRQKAGPHGFVFSFNSDLIANGHHKIAAFCDCLPPSNGTLPLSGSPKCTSGPPAHVVPC